MGGLRPGPLPPPLNPALKFTYKLLWSVPECEKAVDRHDADVPDGRGTHEHVQGRPDDTHVRRQRKVACNVTTTSRSSQHVSHVTFLARDVFIYISRLCYDVSVRLSVRL